MIDALQAFKSALWPPAGGLRQRTMMRHCKALAVVLAAAFAISGAGFAQDFVAQDFMAEPGAPAAAFPKPARPVAAIVSPIWHDEDERDAAGESDQLIRLLGIKSGMTVADIGAGSGYYVVRLSPIVGASGRVIAEDVMPEYLPRLRKRVRGLGLQNVTISLGEPHDPRLPADSVDVAILVHMYHEIAQPYALLYNLVPALKPGRARRDYRRIRADVRTARHPVSCGASLQPWGIARSASIGSTAATPIWPSSRHPPLQAARVRRPSSHASRHSNSKPRS